jgi:hypothetical protein
MVGLASSLLERFSLSESGRVLVVLQAIAALFLVFAAAMLVGGLLAD